MYSVMANDLRHGHCPLCHSDRVRKAGDISYPAPTQFSTHELQLTLAPEFWRCRNCQSGFTQNIIPEEAAIGLYSHGESAERWSREPFNVQKPAEQLKCLGRYFATGSSVLDIGCNTGELLDYAQSLGCQTTGVEYSRASREFLKSKGHEAVPSVADVTGQFDVIAAFDVIEHLYDVPAFLSACKSRLKPNGVLIILTGNIASLSARLCNARWWYLKFPEHIVFPSRNYFVRHSGFKIVDWIPTYASTNLRYGWWKGLKVAVRHGADVAYSGVPSLGPDHVLLVLQ